MSAVCVVLLKQVGLHNRSVSQVNGAVSVFVRRLSGRSLRTFTCREASFSMSSNGSNCTTWLSGVIAGCPFCASGRCLQQYTLELTPDPDSGAKSLTVSFIASQHKVICGFRFWETKTSKRGEASESSAQMTQSSWRPGNPLLKRKTLVAFSKSFV